MVLCQHQFSNTPPMTILRINSSFFYCELVLFQPVTLKTNSWQDGSIHSNSPNIKAVLQHSPNVLQSPYTIVQSHYNNGDLMFLWQFQLGGGAKSTFPLLFMSNLGLLLSHGEKLCIKIENFISIQTKNKLIFLFSDSNIFITT